MLRRQRALGTTFLLFTVFLVSPVLTHAEQYSDVVEEIIVTAQKREQSLQDVPLSVAAFTENMMDLIGAKSMEDLAFRTPNFSFFEASDLKLRPAKIRGVFGGNTGGVDQATGLYIDEVYLGTAVAGNFDLADLERVEILRGPQGTLFGRNTTGGAVSFTTRKPGQETEGYIDTSFGNFDLVRVRGMASGPLIEDKLFGKISAVFHKRDGTSKNVFRGTKTRDQDHWSVRAQLRYLLNDRSEFNLSLDYREVDHKPNARETVQGNFLFQLGIPGLNFTPDGDPLNRKISADFESEETLEAWGVNLNGVIEFNGFDLTTITAYREHDYFVGQDTDMTPLRWAIDGDPEDVWQFSQELRLSSTGERKLDWITGLFYFYQESDNESFAFIEEDLINALPILFGFPPAPAGTTSLFASSFGEVETKSIAGYLHGTYHFTDQLDLTVGGRLTYDDKSIVFSQVDESGTVFPIDLVGAIPEYSNSESWTKFTGDVTLSYYWTDDLMTYAKAARGYKAGGFNDALGSADDPAFDPEFVWNYELGLKSSWADNRLIVNMSAFHMTWDDIQLSGFTTVNRGGQLVFGVITGNFGEAESTGLEVEVVAKPLPGLDIVASLGILDAEFTDDTPAPPGQVPQIQDGAKLPGEEWSWSLGTQYTHQLGDLGDVSARIEYTYHGEQELTAGGDAMDRNLASGHEDSYGLLNARIAFESEDGKWRVALWGQNLTDEDYKVRLQDLDFPPIFSVFSELGEPRTYGIDLRYSF